MTAILVDTHCHLAHVDGSPDEALAEAAEAGVARLVDVGMGTAESRVAVDRAEGSGGRIRAAVGIHPNDLGEYADDPDGTLGRLRELARSPGVGAIGETGLDFYRDREPRDLQEESFRAHVALAKETGKPLVIHCRDAHHDVLRVLDDARPPEQVVMHCFSGDAPYAGACAERGFLCSFAGNVTFKKADELREAAAIVPAELLLVETDAPYLTPEPYRGKRNRPARVVHTARRVAEVRGEDPEALEETLWANASRVFGFPG